MQRGERDLGGADQVQLVLGQRVDLLLGVGQEAGAVQRPLAHEHRRDHRLEAVALQLLQRPAHERQLEHHELAFAGRRSASPTAARRAPCRSSRPPARGGRAAAKPSSATLADLADELVLGSRRGGRVGQVGQRRERRLQLLLDRARARRSSCLDRAPRPRASPRSRARARRRRRRRGCARWPRSARRAAPRSSGSSSRRAVELDHASSAAAPRAAARARRGRLGVLADQPEVEQARSAGRLFAGLGFAAACAGPCRVPALARRAPSWSRVRPPAPGWLPAIRCRFGLRDVRRGHVLCLRPEYLARNAATAWASLPTTMFSGMIAPEKPPLRIA